MLLGAAPAYAAKRVALVIGNSAYEHADRLADPQADSVAMAALFTRLGFTTVEARTDLGLAAMKRALADFELLARGAEVAVFYYSGHGVQIGGQDYLVPIDAELAREVDVPDETVPLDRALRAVSGATQLRLLIVDACRDNPFRAWSGARGLTRGLAPPSDVPGLASTLIAFSASPGEQAVDGPPGGNSPFAASLLNRLPTPGLDIELALRMVTRDVYEATNGRQTPYKAGSLVGQSLPLVPAEAPQPAPDLSALAAPQLCAVATNADHSGWDTRPALRAFVAEAERRGLTPAGCGLPTGASAPTPTPTPTPMPTLAPTVGERPAASVCFGALNADRTDWESDRSASEDVAEARRRGLDVARCRAALGLAEAPATPAPTPTPTGLAGASTQELCHDALNAAHTQWDDRAAYQDQVAEAQRRGLDPAACRAALGAGEPAPTPTPTQTPTALADASTQELCHDALNAAHTQWDDRAAYQDQVAEAQRRGLDPAACRAALAGAPTETPHAGGVNRTQNLVASYADWSVYMQPVGRARICFAVTQPTRRDPPSGGAYLFVSNRPAERVFNEISALTGVDIATNSPVGSIDGADYAFIAKGGHLFVRDPAAEAAVVAAMRAGSTLTIRSKTRAGAAQTDTYSLSGVSQAIDRAAAECAR